MTNLRDISIAELAKNSEGLGLVKSGVNKNQKGEFVDPFTLGKTFPVEFTDEEITARPSGTPQVALSTSIIDADGKLQKAGKLWVDLPVASPNEAAQLEELSQLVVDAHKEGDAEVIARVVYNYESCEANVEIAKRGERFLKFLRAIDPVRFSVFKGIDKSNPKKWVYFDHDGQVLEADDREARAAEIDSAVVAVANGLMDGSVSLVGSQCFVTKRANPNNPKYPYVNFSSAPAQD